MKIDVPDQGEPRAEVTPTQIMDGDVLPEQVGQMFDLRPVEISQFKDNINVLIDYAKSMTDDHSPEGIKWAIRDLSYRVGTPPLGEKLINYLTLYAKLKTQQKEVNNKVNKIERGQDAISQ